MVEMRNALIKDTFREIKRSLSRFLSIFAIVAIGVSFFAGIRATGPDMKITADKYYDDYNLMDIRLVSTIGFNDDDINAIKNTTGVEGIFPTYSMDAMTSVGKKDLVLKIFALPLNEIYTSDASYINRTKLIQGRYPEKPDECLAESGKIVNSGLAIGTKIKLTSGTDKYIGESLKVNEFTVVGIIETPYYISIERGTSPIGSGKINSFIMVPQEDFKIPAYTDVFLTVKNAKNVLSYDDSYQKIIDPVKDSLGNMGDNRTEVRYSEIMKDANEKLDENKKELADAKEKQKKELAAASLKLQNSQRQIEEGERELKYEEVRFNKTVSESEAKIADGYRKLDEGQSQYNLQLQNYSEAQKQAEVEFPAAQQKIDESQKQIDAQEDALNQLKTALTLGQDLPEEQKVQMEASIEAGEQQIAAVKAQLQEAAAELDARKKSLLDAGQQLDNTKKTLDDTKASLDNSKKELEDSKAKASAEFAAAAKRLSASRARLAQGWREYDSSKAESDKKISNAEKEISDAKEQISRIEKPVWYVLDRNTNPGFVDYGSAAERMNAIAEVFPLFFFLVAALVCLTTMTRMVEEQRVNIGTLKALGYSKAAIASKYLLYAALASISGSIFGIAVGFKVFPTVIFNAYGIMYTLPPVVTAFNTFYAVVSTAAAVLITTLAAWAACYSELMVEPAALMRPKAPKAGKRVFLERINFIWRRFNFTQKITARNLLRYKRRFLMTVVGIGGCTALLLSGFGLKDSIMSIVTKQYNELYKYDMIIGLKNNIASGQSTELLNLLQGDKRIKDHMLIREQSIDVGSGRNERSVSLIVPENALRMENFITLRVRTTGEKVNLTDKGVVLTEKLAKQLHVGIGDNIYIKDGDTKKLSVKVDGITENYVSHYVYMSPALYERIYGKKAEFQEIEAKITDTSEDFENKLSTDLMKNKDVGSISFTTGISKNFKDIISSLNYIILVLIVSAGALAFVVLYNLTNINITERLREIATIKVLGFYDSEVSTYVYRENIILTLIGMALGLVFGVFLHRFIVVTAEVDYVMFGRSIGPLSYVYASILTILFSVFVNMVMYFKLKKVSMVESLKSVD